MENKFCKVINYRVFVMFTTIVVAFCTFTSTVMAQTVLSDGNRPPLIFYIGGIGVGTKSVDYNVVEKYGKGFYVKDEGHGGGRYYTNFAHTITLHTVIGVDRCTESLELYKGFQVPGLSSNNIPSIIVSPALTEDIKIDYNIKLSMSPQKLLTFLQKPTNDTTIQGKRIISYETTVAKDNRVSLFYSAQYTFIKNHLVSIILYDGESVVDNE